MEAGRNLDALVAEKVMGWTKHPASRRPIKDSMDYDYHWVPPQFHGDPQYWRALPHYSTTIEAAWQVVERIRQRKLTFTMIACGQWNQVAAEFRQGGKLLGSAGDVSAPIAICLAALRALGIPEGGE